MRFRVGLVFCLFAAYVAVGCRTALTPNIDRNLPPETWITAAPFDTITLDKNGQQPAPATIPVRFHVYWAGSDQDGAVVGYYWAVTETLPTPEEGFTKPPSLPGPKPSDYHYTTHSDSVFIFRVAENVPDRMHVFYVYAVDNLGKPDPTPARFIFSAIDRFPPIPIFLEAYGEGTVYEFDGTGNLVAIPRRYDITDQAKKGTFTRDTVSSNSKLFFRWTSSPRQAGNEAVAYKYKLDEPVFVTAPPGVNSVTYRSGVGSDTNAIAPGIKIFTLRVLDRAEGSEDSTRRFVLNFSPDTWWSGPDPNSPSWHVKAATGEKYVLLSEIKPGGALYPGGIVGSLLSPDSVLIMPANRPERRTFIELWNDTLYFRAENDTVHLNSWTIMHSGGFDTDSPYLVRVSDLGAGLPDFPGGIVLQRNPRPTGSPVGFRLRLNYEMTPDSANTPFGQSGLYPIFDPNDNENLPRIANYLPNFVAGRAYLLGIAEDADGARDARIPSQATGDRDAVQLVHYVESGGHELDNLRRKVMTFYVDKSPYFRTDNPSFTPMPGHVFTDAFWQLVLPVADSDPKGRDYGGTLGASPTLRLRLWVRGTSRSTGQITKYADPGSPYTNRENISLQVDPDLAPGAAELVVEVCDCLTCEATRGEGRCTTWNIPVVYSPPTPTSVFRPGTR